MVLVFNGSVARLTSENELTMRKFASIIPRIYYDSIVPLLTNVTARAFPTL